MGWTHYWERPTELPAQPFSDAVRDLMSLTAASSICVGGFDGTGDPVLEPDHVVFNGQSSQAVEPFEISRVEFERQGRKSVVSYCKTSKMPYDLLVQGALIIFRHHLGRSFQVTSDGDDGLWQSARELVQDVLGFGGDFRLDEQQDAGQ